MILEEVLREVGEIDGFALYSIFMLPTEKNHRQQFVFQLLDNRVSIYGAAENVSIHSREDWYKIDDMLTIHHVLASS